MKNVEIVIIITDVKGGVLKQQVLKALANPARIFYVPYSLAVLNFAVLFVIFVTIFGISAVLTCGAANIDPLYFLISVIISHSVIASFSKKEPQLAQIIAAKVRLYKSRIPKRLIP